MSFQVNGGTFRPSVVPVVIELSAKGVAIKRENEEDLVEGDDPLRVEAVAHAAREEEEDVQSWVAPSGETSADARILNVRLSRVVCLR